MQALSGADHLTCPGCWSNTLAQTLAAPAHQLGGTAWYQCLECNWAGSTDDLREPTDHAQILACMREDQQRGTPGSSGGSKGQKRTGDLTGGALRLRRAWDDGLASSSEHVAPTKSRVVRYLRWTMRVTEQEFVHMLKLASGQFPRGLYAVVNSELGREPISLQEVREVLGKKMIELFSETS